jgi:hypothetical protein
MKLYEIDQTIIVNRLKEKVTINKRIKDEIIISIEKYKYPIKVIYEYKKDELFVITVYPFKGVLK